MMANIDQQRDILDVEQQTAQGQCPLQLSMDAFVSPGYLQILMAKLSWHFLTKSVQPKICNSKNIHKAITLIII